MRTIEKSDIAEMLCTARQDSSIGEKCELSVEWSQPELPWSGLQYSGLNVINVYSKLFQRQDVIDAIVRSTCASCGCARWQHAAYESERASIRERLGLKDDHSTNGKYWTPAGLDKRQCDEYFSALPAEVNDPSLYFSWASRARPRQLPAHDLSAAHCHHLGIEHRQQYDDFIEARNEIALDVGFVKELRGQSSGCRGCDLRITSGEMAVVALKISEDALYHPGCFTCTTCGELLVELAYCAHSGNVYCQRHYAEILRPRCNACDECWVNAMGLLLSVLVSYAGVKEALSLYHHIVYGLLPEGDPEFQNLRNYYCDLLDKSSPITSSSGTDWKSDGGNGYLCVESVKDKIKATVKYCGGNADSASLLFGTTISSFGQESVESGDADYERYRTQIPKSASTETNSSEQQSSDGETRVSDQAAVGSYRSSSDAKPKDDEKLQWHYRPLSTATSETRPTPEIHFQNYEHSGFPVDPNTPYNEDFLRSLDGVKFRPLQRQDPSGRRRSYKKRNSSSSSTSSRASREEELKIFTSLEEAEFETATKNVPDFSSAPNLTANWANRSPRSRSRDHSEEHSVEKIPEETNDDTREKTLLKDIPKMESFDENKDTVSADEPADADEDESSSFWGKNDDW